jgi:hypothetical protein
VTAPSAWGRIVEDTVSRVEGITPTATASTRWHHTKDSKCTTTEQIGGGAFRQFSTVELQPNADVVRVAGGGERQEDWTLVVLATYPRMPGIQGVIAADHVDLIAALAPTITYELVRVAGVVTLCVREVLAPDGPQEAGEGIEVRFPVRCIFRHPVTLV